MNFGKVLGTQNPADKVPRRQGDQQLLHDARLQDGGGPSRISAKLKSNIESDDDL